MSLHCNVIVIFPIYGQFGAIQKPDSGRIVCNSNLFISEKYISHTNALSKCTIFAKKCWHKQNQEGLGTKRYIFWNYMCV